VAKYEKNMDKEYGHGLRTVIFCKKLTSALLMSTVKMSSPASHSRSSCTRSINVYLRGRGVEVVQFMAQLHLFPLSIRESDVHDWDYYPICLERVRRSKIMDERTNELK
jgi:hypothetical protein